MPTLKRNKKASSSSSNTSKTHNFLAQVQQQPQQQEDATAVSSKQQEHNLKHKAADSKEVEEDSENYVVESPESGNGILTALLWPSKTIKEGSALASDLGNGCFKTFVNVNLFGPVCAKFEYLTMMFLIKGQPRGPKGNSV